MKKFAPLAVVLLSFLGFARPAHAAGGVFVFNFTITISTAQGAPNYTTGSPPSANVPISCTATIFTLDSTGQRTFTETATVLAVRSPVGAPTATCKVVVPYSWPVPTSQVQLSTIVQVPGTFTSTSSGLPSRFSSQTLAPLSATPANGAITTKSVAVTI